MHAFKIIRMFFFFTLCVPIVQAQTLTGNTEPVTTQQTPRSNTQPTSQTEAEKAPKDPIEITADGTLEWHRNDNTFIAKKNAVAVQGDTSIAANTLTATYTERRNAGMEIENITAEENVVIKSKDTIVYGDKAVYALDQNLATMSGKALRMSTPNQTLTARDRFEYYINQDKLIALGAVKIERRDEKSQKQTLTANKVVVTLQDNSKGQKELHKADAIGKVVIITATETIKGQKGTYNASTNTANISGNVVITRGPNVLEGARAEVDLNTNTSQIFGAPQTSGRVRGIFYPKSE